MNPETLHAALISFAAQGVRNTSQVIALLLLAERDYVTCGFIAKHTAISTAAVTGMVDHLVKLGLVFTERDKKDRRVQKIMLTTKGDQALSEIIQRSVIPG